MLESSSPRENAEILAWEDFRSKEKELALGTPDNLGAAELKRRNIEKTAVPALILFYHRSRWLGSQSSVDFAELSGWS
jgi:hypothetical protein